ncbi:MAG: hypothetical protein QXI22_05610 [Sulfolobales archaeon]
MFRTKPHRSSATVVEIITINPIMLGHCEHCEILMKGFGVDYKPRQVSEYPEDLLELSKKLTIFINMITRRVFARVVIIEALTLRGLFKMIMYRGGRLPIIAVNGKKIAVGTRWEPEALAKKVLEMITN